MRGSLVNDELANSSSLWIRVLPLRDSPNGRRALESPGLCTDGIFSSDSRGNTRQGCSCSARYRICAKWWKKCVSQDLGGACRPLNSHRTTPPSSWFSGHGRVACLRGFEVLRRCKCRMPWRRRIGVPSAFGVSELLMRLLFVVLEAGGPPYCLISFDDASQCHHTAHREEHNCAHLLMRIFGDPGSECLLSIISFTV